MKDTRDLQYVTRRWQLILSAQSYARNACDSSNHDSDTFPGRSCEKSMTPWHRAQPSRWLHHLASNYLICISQLCDTPGWVFEPLAMQKVKVLIQCVTFIENSTAGRNRAAWRLGKDTLWDRVLPVHDMRANKGSKGKAPPILTQH
jgi:hypothetical protein